MSLPIGTLLLLQPSEVWLVLDSGRVLRRGEIVDFAVRATDWHRGWSAVPPDGWRILRVPGRTADRVTFDVVPCKSGPERSMMDGGAAS